MAIRVPDTSVTVDQFPDNCPACDHGISPVYCYSHLFDRSGKVLQVVLRCPRKDCSRLFIARYTETNYHYSDTLYLQKYYLLDYVKFSEFPESVNTFSPEFSKIYNQSEVAEKNSLKLICGPGYRKSLEFLVKDYLMATMPEQADDIKKKYLSTAIKMIEDKNIEACASRAAWLGNDETHYIRKWTDKDISDLKNLIMMVVNWIDLNERSRQYIEAMPSPEALAEET